VASGNLTNPLVMVVKMVGLEQPFLLLNLIQVLIIERGCSNFLVNLHMEALLKVNNRKLKFV